MSFRVGYYNINSCNAIMVPVCSPVQLKVAVIIQKHPEVAYSSLL